MAAETAAIRDKTRRVKNHILDKYLKLADLEENNQLVNAEDKAFLRELTLKFASNVIPRSQEISGEDGEPILVKQITGMQIINDGTPIQNKESETAVSS